MSAWMSTRVSTQPAVVEDGLLAIRPGRGDTGGAAGVGNRSRLDDHVALEATGIAHAEQIAAVAPGLCSQNASFATGTALIVDGGQIA
jgi:NAD(P)-dependent dehydrogenase (short-subunit alcohol dehydrogenase family)